MFIYNHKQFKSKDLRCFHLVKVIKKGEVITDENVRSIRPGFGMHPKYLKEILGKIIEQDLEKGDRFKKDYI